MAETNETKIGKVTYRMDGEDYVLEGGGGGLTPGVPIPHDTVDSDAIIDGAVQMRDLNDEVKDEMVTQDDRVTQEDLDRFQV